MGATSTRVVVCSTHSREPSEYMKRVHSSKEYVDDTGWASSITSYIAQKENIHKQATNSKQIKGKHPHKPEW